MLVVVLAACKVDATVRVGVRDDGSGTVTARIALDAAAVAAAESGGTKLETAVRLGDLRAAGWRAAWRRPKAGGAVLVLSKGFARARDAGAVVAELNGPDGPLRDVRVTRDVSTFSTEWTFSGVGDLRDVRTGVANDPELLAALGAARVDVAGLDQSLLLQAEGALRLRVAADLPAAGTERFPVPTGKRVVMHTASSARALGRMALLALGIAVVLLALVLLVVGERRSRRRALRAGARRSPGR